MSESARPTPRQPAAKKPRTRRAGDESSLPDEPEELLSVLGDEYAREILTAVSDEALPAREIAERVDVSRPTAYRRLNRLESVGLVESSMSHHPEGHHRKRFRATLAELSLSFSAGEISVEPT